MSHLLLNMSVVRQEGSKFGSQGEIVSFYGYGVQGPKPIDPKAPLVPPIETGPQSRIERLKEKKQLSLGELNPMLFPPDFSNPDAISSLQEVVRMQIEALGGVQPQSFETRLLADEKGKLHPRLIAKFEMGGLNENQVAELENLAKSTYGGNIVRTRKSSSGHPLKPTNYPTTELTSSGRPKTAERNRMLGWQMGLAEGPATHLDTGIFIYKDLGGSDMARFVQDKKPADWFFSNNLLDPMSGKKIKTKHLIEMREVGLYQTDIATLMVQMSSILAGRGPIPHDELFYDVYNSLNRLGLKKAGTEDIYGLDDAIERLDRTLIGPLASLELSTGIDLNPGSALLIGVPGTGKTLIVEHLLQKDTGILIVPVDAAQLAKDLSKQPEQRDILTRINKVFARTQIPVVLHIDDVENIAQNDQQINATLLNLMAGVRETGFYVIASTNFPEKLSEQLLQPQRFANVVYFGLQDEQSRLGILNVHATKVSKELGRELFAATEQRELMLQALAKHTENFTPRYLAEICTEAKSFLLARLARNKNKQAGLREEDLDITFNVEDWERALHEASKKYNKEEVVKRDKELGVFAERHYRNFGFVVASPNQTVLTRTLEELAAARKNSPQNEHTVN